MVNYKDVKLQYTSPAFPPDGININSLYSIVKKDGVFCIKLDQKEIQMEKELIQMLFTPQDKKLKWEDVDFSDKVEVKSKFK